MSQWITIARPYANALFEQADKAGLLHEWCAILRVLRLAVAESSMATVINSPHYTDKQIQSILLSVIKAMPGFSVELEPAVDNFITVLINSKRLLALADIDVLYGQLLAQHEGVVSAQVQSARPLGDGEIARVQHYLEKQFNAKAQLHFVTDPALIGGVVIKVGSWVMDGSVKNRLARLSESLRG